MEALDDGKFIDSLFGNLNLLPSKVKKDFGTLKEVFNEEDIYVVGGFVRDSVLKDIYGHSFSKNDLDILVDDGEFHSKIGCFSEKGRTTFGGLKLRYGDFSVDVFSLQEIYFLKDFHEKNIQNFFKGIDLSTSSLAYNVGENKIYDFGALEDIMKREINVVGNCYVRIAPTVARLILHANKMNFKIGQKGIDYVKENYSEDLDFEMNGWLEYKKIPNLFPLIKDKINSIVE